MRSSPGKGFILSTGPLRHNFETPGGTPRIRRDGPSGDTTVTITGSIKGTRITGGWPSFSDACLHHFHRGCPILAFFARVGGDAAWAFLPVLGNGRRHFQLRPFAKNAKDGHPALPNSSSYLPTSWMHSSSTSMATSASSLESEEHTSE